MAAVDFTNAIIEPSTLTGWSHPVAGIKISADTAVLTNSSLTRINSGSTTKLVSEKKRLTILHEGTFTASGTEFYIRGYSTDTSKFSGWKISNISFSSGDTYAFQIDASLVCN